MTLHLSEPLPDYCVPVELLLHEPLPEHIKQYFPSGDYERKISTNTALDPHEKEGIARLKKLQELSGVQLTRSMQSRVLRYLSHTRGDEVNALDALVHTQEWRRTFFNPRLSDTLLKDQLNTGLLYFCGRDSGLRPFLVVRAKVAFDKSLKWKATDITNLFAFCMEFALRYLLIPGKAETLVVILDLASVSVNNLRSENLRSILHLLSKHYVGRLYQLLVVNPPTMLSTVWGVAKSFLSDRQVAKTAFIKKCDVASGRCAKHQLEVQYGGSMPTLTEFYPFTFPPGPFDVGHVGGADAGAVAHGYRCLSAQTVHGALAETDVVPPIKWSSKGKRILTHLGIACANARRPNRCVSYMTDFPDEKDLTHSDDMSVNDQEELLKGLDEEGAAEEQKGQDEDVPSIPEQAEEPIPKIPGSAQHKPEKDLDAQPPDLLSTSSSIAQPQGDNTPLKEDTETAPLRLENLKSLSLQVGSLNRTKDDLADSKNDDNDDGSDGDTNSTLSSNPMSARESQRALKQLRTIKSEQWRASTKHMRFTSFKNKRLSTNARRRRTCLWCCVSSEDKFVASPNPGKATE